MRWPIRGVPFENAIDGIRARRQSVKWGRISGVFEDHELGELHVRLPSFAGGDHFMHWSDVALHCVADQNDGHPLSASIHK
jgi:hypothetical protein